MNKKDYFLSVGALVWDQSGRLLLLRRSLDSKYFAGEWEPPGGKLGVGEGIGAATRRETWEETRLEINLETLAGMSEVELAAMRIVILYFNVRALPGSPSISKEHCDLKWVVREDLIKMNLTEAFRRFVAAPGFDANASARFYSRELNSGAR